MSNKKQEMTLNEKLNKAIELVDKAEGVDIDGKRYTTVSERVKILRQVFGFDIKFTNLLKYFDGLECQFECRIFIRDENNEWVCVANGYSHEKSSTSAINKQSFLEVAETSALGRAIAFLGLFGNSIASADEITTKSESKKTIKEGSELKGQKNKLIKNIRDLIKLDPELTEEYVCETRKVEKLSDLSIKDLKEALNVIQLKQDDDCPI